MDSRSLKRILNAISQMADEEQLRTQVVPMVREHFAAAKAGIFFFDRSLSESRLSPLLKKAAASALSIELNPIARYLSERHAPTHNAATGSLKAWRAICPRPDHWHVIAGPIVSGGQLIGALGCTREKGQSAFHDQYLADISAICLHLSVWAATTRSPQLFERLASAFDEVVSEETVSEVVSLSARLTARERQIAELVATGKKNAEVGAELFITENSVKQALKKIFRKLEVSSRTQMARQLSEEKHARK